MGGINSHNPFFPLFMSSSSISLPSLPKHPFLYCATTETNRSLFSLNYFPLFFLLASLSSSCSTTPPSLSKHPFMPPNSRYCQNTPYPPFSTTPLLNPSFIFPFPCHCHETHCSSSSMLLPRPILHVSYFLLVFVLVFFFSFHKLWYLILNPFKLLDINIGMFSHGTNNP